MGRQGRCLKDGEPEANGSDPAEWVVLCSTRQLLSCGLFASSHSVSCNGDDEGDGDGDGEGESESEGEDEG